ncbi:hypothetical protein Pint_31525 [Pistacia integerrima]|uniref:Uncharacterized protein n=2 Tax=Pistacia TaxID=55512 RepID=A0ACC1AC62_9ROSI|nr:hypothetical protein Pint_31525 [Pistacia integerrima]KAJ0083608.1 hypothetical protein Patl1_30113 [Pistacia atlantica]
MKRMNVPGGITEVDLTKRRAEMDDLARFAVDEYNKEHHSKLKFVKVEKAMEQVVSGMMYYITLEANDEEKKYICVAKVWEKVWMQFRKLEDFQIKTVFNASAN